MADGSKKIYNSTTEKWNTIDPSIMKRDSTTFPHQLPSNNDPVTLTFENFTLQKGKAITYSSGIFTVHETGTYLIQARVTADLASGPCETYINAAGADYAGFAIPNSAPLGVFVYNTVFLNVDDTFSIIARATAGNGINLVAPLNIIANKI